MPAGLVDPPSGRGYILADVRAPYSMAVFFSHFEGAVALKKAMKIKNMRRLVLLIKLTRPVVHYYDTRALLSSLELLINITFAGSLDF